jgi:metal-responsive CopG/Arc/MetJ family transcriptional regulator
VFTIPIISISINENLRKFINKLISKNQYENKSKIIRDALLRLMSSMEISNMENAEEFKYHDKNIIGNMIIVAPHDPQIQKKILKIENRYHDQIVSKNIHFQGENAIIFLLIDANVEDFQNLVVDINGIEDIKNFRYLIVN